MKTIRIILCGGVMMAGLLLNSQDAGLLKPVGTFFKCCWMDNVCVVLRAGDNLLDDSIASLHRNSVCDIH